ncbi:MAG: NAD(P)-dependent oxidoreductase [Candidatus Dormibacteria bacterium]
MSYPVTLQLRDRPCTVLGGGPLAAEKARGLVGAGARVTVLAASPGAEVEALGSEGAVDLLRRDYAPGDLAGRFLAIDASEDEETHRRSFTEAEERGVLLNVVDRPQHCHFHAPALVRRGPLCVAVSTGGESPFLAGALRARLERAEAEALGIRDVVTCPGADTCNLGITSSRGLGRAVSRWLDGARLQDLPEFAGTSIKASGCPNSCSQHHVATVGFYGNSKHVGDDPVPHYMLMLGGGVDARGARMAQPVMKIPARRVPLALERLVGQYREEREGGELFAAWVERADREAVRMCLEDLALSDSPSEAEVVDWDQEVAFTGRTGEGECAV